MQERPDRGRILIVNFELGGVPALPEMDGTQRPCVVVQNNVLDRPGLVTVVPISMTPPLPGPGKQHHLLSHLSFRDWPLDWDGQGAERWAKCDYVATLGLKRCSDPYRRLQADRRRYIKVKITKSDLEAIERCVFFALGIDPQRILLNQTTAQEPISPVALATV
jgi:uncharacterized protein YifN (PemK superfamily)